MKKPNCAFLNFIVSILAIAAIAGYFFLPLWNISAKVTFTEELSRLILTDSDAEKSEDAEDNEEDILDVLADGLIV